MPSRHKAIYNVFKICFLKIKSMFLCLYYYITGLWLSKHKVVWCVIYEIYELNTWGKSSQANASLSLYCRCSCMFITNMLLPGKSTEPCSYNRIDWYCILSRKITMSYFLSTNNCVACLKRYIASTNEHNHISVGFTPNQPGTRWPPTLCDSSWLGTRFVWMCIHCKMPWTYTDLTSGFWGL